MNNIHLNNAPNYKLYNYTGVYDNVKFNFRVSTNGKDEIHRFELHDWDGNPMESISIDDVIEIYFKQSNEEALIGRVNSVLKDERLKKHSNNLWYI